MITPGLAPAKGRINRDLALLVFVVVGCAIPFMGQAFHMDDNFYMDMARHARVDPLFPNDTPYKFMGESLPDMGSHSHPPLQTYFLAVIQSLAGEGPGREWIYHSASLVFPLIAVVSLYFISARFVSRPLWPALALACSPVFLVMQHSLMTDVPTLAWWLAAVATFFEASDSGRNRWFLASAAFQFAAMFTSYQSVSLTPLLAFWLWRSGGKRQGWVWLAAAPLLMAAWFGVNYAHYGRFLLFDTAGYIGSRGSTSAAALWTKLLAVVQYQGWLVLFPLFLLYAFARVLRGRLLALSLILGSLAAQLVVPSYRFGDKVIFVVGIVTGSFVVLRFLRLVRETGFTRAGRGSQTSNTTEFLLLWYGGVFFYCLALFTEGSARYVLPLVPPLLITFFRDLERAEVIEYREPPGLLPGSAVAASGSIILSLAWGLMLSFADLEHAGVYPSAAQDLRRLSGRSTGWFGGEWGFRYYFAASGFGQLPADETRVRGGDWIALPRLALPYGLAPGLRSMASTVQTLSYGTVTPLRLIDSRTPAGFYSTGWGLLPFSFSRRGVEEVEVLQVNYFVDHLPEATLFPAGEKPYPQYVELGGRRELALLLGGGMKLSFPWEFKSPAELEVLCALDGAPAGRERRLFLRHVDDDGVLRVEDRVDMRAGAVPGSRSVWRTLKVRAPGAGRIEISVEGAGVPGRRDAVFADPIVRQVDR